MEGLLQLLLDDVYFVNDLLEAGIEPLCHRMVSALLSQFLMPSVIHPITGGSGGGRHEGCPSPSAAPEEASSSSAVVPAGGEQAEPLPRLLALLVLSHCLSIFTHPPLLACINTLCLHPRLRLADVQISKLDQLHSAALDRARSACVSSLSLSRETSRAEVDSDLSELSGGGGGALGGSVLGVLGGVFGSGGGSGSGGGGGGGGGPPASGEGGGVGVGGVLMPIGDDGPDRNDLRGAMLGMLASGDERYVLLACCALLSSIRCTSPPKAAGGTPTPPPGHAELLKQARGFFLPHSLGGALPSPIVP